MTNRSRQKQKEDICSIAKAVWTTGASSTSLISLLKRAAGYHKCHLQDLTDDQIEEWLHRESNTIYEMCVGSSLNGSNPNKERKQSNGNTDAFTFGKSDPRTKKYLQK